MTRFQIKRRNHGLRNHPSYEAWLRMMKRCYYPNEKRFEYYGGRGIKVCKRWHKIENFVQDMGVRPKGRLLDRKNVNGNYHKRNCRWVTHHESANNKTNNIFVTIRGQRKTIKQWCKIFGLKHFSVYPRLRKGWEPKRALTPSTIKTISYGGKTRRINEWAKITGVHWRTLRWRLEKGWSIERSFS